jgi:hypothetical protein
MRAGEMNYILDEMRKLKGYTVTGVALDDESDPSMPMPALVLKREHHKKLAWVQRDPEGNGTGFLLVEDYSQEVRA